MWKIAISKRDWITIKETFAFNLRHNGISDAIKFALKGVFDNEKYRTWFDQQAMYREGSERRRKYRDERLEQRRKVSPALDEFMKQHERK